MKKSKSSKKKVLKRKAAKKAAPAVKSTMSGGTPEARWIAVDEFADKMLGLSDSALDAAQADADKAGMPQIAVSPAQGKLLMILAKAMGARRILEIGTLAGYSTIWMARALPPDGKLITLEYEPKHVEVARKNLDRAGLAGKVEVRAGAAIDSLRKLVAEGAGPFDLIFIDVDKQGYADYFALALKLSRPGTMIVADNVVRRGRVADAAANDENTLGIRRFYKAVAAENRVTATQMQTVGVKGYDGLAFVLVTG